MKKILNSIKGKLINFKNRLSLHKKKNEKVLYIGGTEVLPPPLSREEESECLVALATEQEEEARKKLISHNLRLVVYLARKFENTG